MSKGDHVSKQRIVVIGGGTGTHTVLRGLVAHHEEVAITAIVTMADSGGSTGRLRDEFGQLPVGDVRMALAALASGDDEHERLLREVFLHRFATSGELSGHTFGNLFLVTLREILGSDAAAIAAASRILKLRGQVLPVTYTTADLVATYADGVTITGEGVIDDPPEHRTGVTMTGLALTPAAALSEEAAAAIAAADLIVLGPGDLYTSVLANCVVDGMPETLQAASAPLVYVANLMTKRGQTDGMDVAAHTEMIAHYVGQSPDVVLVNTDSLPDELRARYASEGEYPVLYTEGSVDTRVYHASLLAEEEVVTAAGDRLRRSLLRHDPEALTAVLRQLLNKTTPFSTL